MEIHYNGIAIIWARKKEDLNEILIRNEGLRQGRVSELFGARIFDGRRIITKGKNEGVPLVVAENTTNSKEPGHLTGGLIT